MSTLEFQLTAEDYAAFNLHHALTSRNALRQQRRARVNTTVAVLVVSMVVVSLVSGRVVEGIFVAIAATLVSWLIFPWSWRRALSSSLRQTSVDHTLSTLGGRRLTVDHEGLIETRDGTTISAHWDDVERVDETPTHVFVYVGPTSAFIVPRRVGESEIQTLLSEIEANRVQA